MFEELVLYRHGLRCRFQHRDQSLTAGKSTVTFSSKSLQLYTSEYLWPRVPGGSGM